MRSKPQLLPSSFAKPPSKSMFCRIHAHNSLKPPFRFPFPENTLLRRWREPQQNRHGLTRYSVPFTKYLL
jgi:hypothetical protein